MKFTRDTVLYWLPRIATILGIGFISLFSLDAFSGNLSIFEKLMGFMIHLIPSFVLIGILTFAWKNEKVGGVVFLLLSGVFWLYFDNPFSVNSILFGPFIFAGTLFLIDGFDDSRKYNKS